jgi:high affinity Mn2+ porin
MRLSTTAWRRTIPRSSAGRERPTRRTRPAKAGAAFCLALFGASARWSLAQEASPEAGEAQESRANVHFQLTTVTQAHPSFDAAYSGQNSLHPESEHETTVTSTLYVGARLWKEAEIYVNPELSGGSGLSKAFGIAGFPNGESFRVGSPEPHIYLGRLMLRQTFAAGAETEPVEDEANQLGGRRPVRRWTITAGKFGITDVLDDNSYSHDPRTQFLNWADWTPGAWDYPADTRGYTWGAAIEYESEVWAVRLVAAAEPKEANGLEIDKTLRSAHALSAELERKFELGGQKGAARLILFDNRARMGNYRQAIQEAGGGAPDIIATRREGRSKWGFVVNLEQALGEQGGLFFRGSWNDGRNEAWAYAEIERSVTIGGVRKEPLRSRPKDEAGLAFIINALSPDHRDYLAAGGLGFMIGDGRLNYGLEKIAELYYKALLRKELWLTTDYQFIQNPAYNRDRGPVHVFGLRLHVEL